MTLSIEPPFDAAKLVIADSGDGYPLYEFWDVRITRYDGFVLGYVVEGTEVIIPVARIVELVPDLE